jgi:hypothetical protein
MLMSLLQDNFVFRHLITHSSRLNYDAQDGSQCHKFHTKLRENRTTVKESLNWDTYEEAHSNSMVTV